MNSEQRKAMQIIAIILCCFGIYTYTAVVTPVIHYCDFTGLEIKQRIGHEVTFTFENGTVTHYCCVNISLLAFEVLIDSGQLDDLENIQVRCPMCGMIMDWNDPMIVWVFSIEYLNPTTNEPTIVPLCEDVEQADMCENHFLDIYGGVIINNPYNWM